MHRRASQSEQEPTVRARGVPSFRSLASAIICLGQVLTEARDGDCFTDKPSSALSGILAGWAVETMLYPRDGLNLSYPTAVPESAIGVAGFSPSSSSLGPLRLVLDVESELR